MARGASVATASIAVGNKTNYKRKKKIEEEERRGGRGGEGGGGEEEEEEEEEEVNDFKFTGNRIP